MSNRTATPTPANLTQALQELLASDVSPQEFTRRLFAINVAQACASDPLLAEVMPKCAIPPSFDAEIIGVLRDAPDDPETNTRLLGQLAPFNYVQQYEDRSYAYHDTVRDMLLDEWQAEEKQGEYAQIARRLAYFYFERGKQQYREKDYNAALSSLNEALNLHDDIRFYRWRGIVYAELEQSEEAIQDLDRVLAVHPDDGLAIGERGCAYHQLKRYAEALQDLTRAIALPYDEERGMSAEYHYSLYHYWRGRVYYAQQNYSAGVDDFRKVIELQPEEDVNYWRYGQNHHAVVADFRKAIAVQPRKVVNYHGGRGVLQKHADLSESEQHCREIVDQLFVRHGWQLLDRNEFVQQTWQTYTAGFATDCYRAATAVYSHALYHACSGTEGVERQNIGYTELFHYLFNSAARRYADVCEDATQRAMERIYTGFARCREPGAFLSFAFYQLMDAARTLRRQDQRFPHSLDAPVDINADSLADLLPDYQQPDIVSQAITKELQGAFHQLAEEFKQKHPRSMHQFYVLWLKYVEGLDDVAIGQQLNTSVDNVYVLRARALKKLRAEETWWALAVQFGILTEDT